MRLWMSLLSVIACCLLIASPAHAQKKSTGNVVLIIADDLGLDTGAYGNDAINMPNLDKLAKNGVLFTQAYATVASCSASRGSILTGLYTHQNGQFGHAHLPHSQTTHPYIKTLPFLLRQAGVFTGLIGKFHVAPPELYPFHELMVKGTGGNRDPVAMSKLARQFISKAKGRRFFLVYSASDPHRGGKAFYYERF